MGRVNFDEYSASYNEIMKRNVGFFEKERGYFAEYKIEIMARLIKEEPTTILEYGCGIGRNLKYLREKFPHALLSGCDVSQNSIVIAQNENPDVHFFIIGRDDFDRKYDLILVANVIHHIAPENRVAVIKDVVNLLNNGGNLFVFEHNPLNLVTRKLVSSCPFDSDAILIGPGKLRRLLRSSKLEIRCFGYCLFFPGFLKKFRGIEPSLRWLPLGGQYYMNAYKP